MSEKCPKRRHKRTKKNNRAKKGAAQKGQKRPPIVIQHGWAKKRPAPRPQKPKDRVESEFDGQPRYEGGYRIVQGGIPGSGQS